MISLSELVRNQANLPHVCLLLCSPAAILTVVGRALLGEHTNSVGDLHLGFLHRPFGGSFALAHLRRF